MTYIEAQKLIDKEQNEKYYSASPLNTGNVNIIRVGDDGDDGFIYSRETEYVKVVGVLLRLLWLGSERRMNMKKKVDGENEQII